MQEIRAMSMFVNTQSFWQQDQNWGSGATTQLGSPSVLSTSPAALFAGNNTASSSGSTSAEKALQATLGPFGATVMNASTGAAVLAAQQASNRVNAATAKISNNQPAKSVGNVASQTTFAGSAATPGVFGSIGAASNGGYQFVSGAALQKAFSVAMIGKTSNGEAIDTVTVTGNTLIASTSGINAHQAFRLSLKPDSGLYTFTLVNPVDLKTSRLDQSVTMDLSQLIHAVRSDGSTASLQNSTVIEVHNGLGTSTGTANRGVVHEGGLAYTGPTNTAPAATNTPVKPPKYVAPTNPLTGYAYTAQGSALSANAIALNVLT
jgi:hypothetical protein